MTVRPVGADPGSIPPAIQHVRDAAARAIGELEPAGSPKSQIEARGLFLSSRTNGGRDLPPYYLVYFLLVDLLGFPNLGESKRSHGQFPSDIVEDSMESNTASLALESLRPIWTQTQG